MHICLLTTERPCSTLVIFPVNLIFSFLTSVFWAAAQFPKSLLKTNILITVAGT